jgi:succinate dehydrogenase / fumarate reductase, cytochrome b subunit
MPCTCTCGAEDASVVTYERMGTAVVQEHFYTSTTGKKAAMAVSGCILFLFVVGHLIGNLQIYEGPDKLNRYAVLLRSMPALLWTVRAVLLAMVLLHIWSSVQLAGRNIAARPVGYRMKKSAGSSYASRTMYWSGPIILAFVVYHLLDFTFGTVNPRFQPGNVYGNVVASFQLIPVAAFYIIAMLLLCLHLYHGLWSMFQSLGIAHPRYTPMLRKTAGVVAILIAAGNISIPVAVLAGWVR